MSPRKEAGVRLRSHAEEYGVFVFDCDGVILNSNAVKTRAFYEAALPYGKDAAESLVKYHIANGGVSRYAKFRWFLRELLKAGEDAPRVEELLSAFSGHVREGLANVEAADGLRTLRGAVPEATWLVVSGSAQEELREVLSWHGIADLFDGGIFGSPRKKRDILHDRRMDGTLRGPAIMFGDSRLDWESALAEGLDFMFIYGWTEVSDWNAWCQSNDIVAAETVKDAFRRLGIVKEGYGAGI